MPEKIKVSGNLISQYDERSLLSWVFLHALTEKEIREHDPKDWPELSRLRETIWPATADYYQGPDRDRMVKAALDAAKAVVDRANKEGHEKTAPVSAKRDETDTVEIIFSVNGVELPVVKAFEDLGKQYKQAIAEKAAEMVRDTLTLRRLTEAVANAESDLEEKLRDVFKRELDIDLRREED